MPLWLVWLIVAVGLGSAEALSGDFVLFMCGVGAGAGAVTAAAGGPPELQIAVALVVAVGMVFFVRPIAKRHFLSAELHQSGTSALVGKPAVVLVAVDGQDGRIRLNGQEWSARALSDGQLYTAGTTVRVMRIAGATAIVYDDPTL
jgi:membrane protein implicated in regulation of membrane protease activity